MKTNIKDIARISIIASMYIVFTIINPFSYNAIQFRISEILMILCFFRKDYSIGLILGCLISNLFSEIMLYDIIFGTLATILACICMMFSKNIYISILYPIIFNSLLVGFELYLAFNTPFIMNAIYVFIGETVVMLIGLVIFNKLRKNKHFLELIDANQNI